MAAGWASYEINHHDFDLSRVHQGLKSLLVDDTFGQAWVLDTAADLVGNAIATWSRSLESGGRDSILDEIWVTNPSAGAGFRLLSATLSGARASGARAVFLETETHNQRGRPLYQRHGFAVEDSVWTSRSPLA